MTSEKPDIAGLFELASTQLGYFTSAQASTFGFAPDLLSYHTKTGRFLRVRRGIYRFRDYPATQYEEEMVAWLVVGRETSVISHESALDMFDLSDVIPAQIHLTVPRSRRNLPGIPGVVIHTTSHRYHDVDVVGRQGFRVSSPGRAIIDAAAAGVAPEQVEMAVYQALQRGLTVPEFLTRSASTRSRRVRELISAAIKEAPA